MTIKIKPRTQKDFEWTRWNEKHIAKYITQSKAQIQKDIAHIIAIPKEQRTFENTVYALMRAGQVGHEDNPIFVLADVSPKEGVRNSARTARQEIEKVYIDVLYTKPLYNAFMEYNPTSEKLSEVEFRLYTETKQDFERAGFHLNTKDFEKVKKLQKQLSDFEVTFSANISKHHDYILCTHRDLDGLSEEYISNLEKDAKTGKYMVTLAYPEVGPFLDFATNEAKRKELADKLSQKGGKANIALLKKMFTTRQEVAKLLGYTNYAEYIQETKMAKKPKVVKDFLTNTIKKLQPIAKKEFKELETFAKKELGISKISYDNVAFAVTKMQEKVCGFNKNELKQYFEINHVFEEMFLHFGSLFGLTFQKNTTIQTWHKDVLVFDIVEKGKILSHIMLDLYPRKGKYSHMCCAGIMDGGATTFRGKEHTAPVALIIGNFPKGSPKNPSLLSFGEIETLFHEFGHAMHLCLCHADFASQGAFGVAFDFVEVPSQLFENWVEDPKLLTRLSRHIKTGQQISPDLAKKVIASLHFRKASNYYGTFVLSLLDFEFHTTKYQDDPMIIAKQYNEKYAFVQRSPKSLFPAGWGHLTSYAGLYYSYMWSLVYSYDIFSRFEKEGVYNKKVGKDLRTLLASGDTKDAMDLMRDFLGREPDNEAFLKALGIEK